MGSGRCANSPNPVIVPFPLLAARLLCPLFLVTSPKVGSRSRSWSRSSLRKRVSDNSPTFGRLQPPPPLKNAAIQIYFKDRYILSIALIDPSRNGSSCILRDTSMRSINGMLWSNKWRGSKFIIVEEDAKWQEQWHSRISFMVKVYDILTRGISSTRRYSLFARITNRKDIWFICTDFT